MHACICKMDSNIKLAVMMLLLMMMIHTVRFDEEKRVHHKRGAAGEKRASYAGSMRMRY
jgi:hypothetical protein